ncbi:hypothetical protein DASC09_045930 [Saccharomycopsis crataegensis]|uniref:Uncharacterized protein n=1 Tax=Saccharomycopsis crataegensis TaxID=43959 RepID=A0AAV5QR51_9ASCO|nr:hypothetical protein DASC09_045930 [Saccharomycopsis crataegensis]
MAILSSDSPKTCNIGSGSNKKTNVNVTVSSHCTNLQAHHDEVELEFDFDGWQTDGLEDGDFEMMAGDPHDDGDNDDDDTGINQLLFNHDDHSHDFSMEHDDDELHQHRLSTMSFIKTLKPIIKPSHFSACSFHQVEEHHRITTTTTTTRTRTRSVDYSSISERDYSDMNYESESSQSSICLSLVDGQSTKHVTTTTTKTGINQQHVNSKKVRFNTTTSLIGVSELDTSELPSQKTLHEICRERRLLKAQRNDDDYLLFENDPDFKDLECLTQKLTRINASLTKLRV